jgi:hypothetical protein
MTSGDVLTVRIPELPEHVTILNADRIAIWSSEDNRTRFSTIQSLREFIEIGETGTYGPVQTGTKLLYIVPADKNGEDTVLITAIAGKNFGLTRDGFPMKPQNPNPLTPDPDAEYEILGAGGFQLLGTTLITDQRFELDVYELNAGTIPPSGGSGSGFIAGEVPVNTNINISVNDLNKLYQVRGASNALTINLPDVNLCPEKSFVIIECLITNQKQHSINTTGGQYIYINNESRTTVYISKGEYIWLYRTEEGWFAITDKGNFTNLAMPKAAYKVGLNQVLCDGSLLLRADYPRLWEFIQTLGTSFVSEATWQTASVVISGRTVLRPYRGCFSDGTSSLNFRLPDLMNMALRGVKNVGGSDTERHLNAAGGYQDPTMPEHYHTDGHETTGSGTEFRKGVAHPTEVAAGPGAGNVTQNIISSTGKVISKTDDATFGVNAGVENRMENIGILWVIDY